MKNFTFIVIDANPNAVLKTKAVAESFQNLLFLGSASTYDEGIDCVLEQLPDIIFLEIDNKESQSDLSLDFINVLYRYLTVVPKIIITTTHTTLAYDALKYGVYDYLLKPLEPKELRKTLARLNKEAQIVMPLAADSKAILNTATTTVMVTPTIVESELRKPSLSDSNVAPVAQKEKPLVLCIKSYGDYRYINASDICYLHADNNSTDLHLSNGEIITAFKSLKHFESLLKKPFYRIHNSYIVNTDFVSRIHTGNSICYIKNTTTKLPFSKSYKETIDQIIAAIAEGNYLEI
ncbi:LytTR family transcriptional regulator DNA-binding domain-containing protein [Flavobacterium sp. SUN046]|uniref:LytR/AlgR family response regulator transcription factor n=1 Tax=Flavobacterium sp. SUN046 TaxID=3002440 RepID=UPI002DB5C39A|nr:LytTR family transcriptional regulator DNA-binding domain-containing protein [Flavobacterium sp. SUN046]MEC4048000.1 LytTR family transcriptional regulator DNA-binding domain-containing protein [Flavobacterium sp. SUN046]